MQISYIPHIQSGAIARQPQPSDSVKHLGKEGVRMSPIFSSFNQHHLVGGFNLIEKYQSDWIISPRRGENQKYLKPPPSHGRIMDKLE